MLKYGWLVHWRSWHEEGTAANIHGKIDKENIHTSQWYFVDRYRRPWMS